MHYLKSANWWHFYTILAQNNAILKALTHILAAHRIEE